MCLKFVGGRWGWRGEERLLHGLRDAASGSDCFCDAKPTRSRIGMSARTVVQPVARPSKGVWQCFWQGMKGKGRHGVPWDVPGTWHVGEAFFCVKMPPSCAYSRHVGLRQRVKRAVGAWNIAIPDWLPRGLAPGEGASRINQSESITTMPLVSVASPHPICFLTKGYLFRAGGML